MPTDTVYVPTDTEEFWEWLRKRGERQQNAYIEATLELPKPPKPKFEKEESNNDIWTDVDYTVYEL